MIPFIIFIMSIIILEIILILLFGPDVFEYIYLGLIILIITIPGLILIMIVLISLFQNPIIGILVIATLIKLLLSL